MGIYLNSKSPFGQFLDEAAATYFVDKSEMLTHLIPLTSRSESYIGQAGGNIGKSNKYICNKAPAFWKDHNGLYDCFLFRERNKHQFCI